MPSSTKYLILVWSLGRWLLYSHTTRKSVAKTGYDYARGIYEQVRLLKTETLQECKPPCRRPKRKLKS